jgi:hypothetical protein
LGKSIEPRRARRIRKKPFRPRRRGENLSRMFLFPAARVVLAVVRAFRFERQQFPFFTIHLDKRESNPPSSLPSPSRHSRESGNPGRTFRRIAPHPLNLNWRPFGLEARPWILAFAGMTG